jgi:hypothetical protein
LATSPAGTVPPAEKYAGALLHLGEQVFQLLSHDTNTPDRTAEDRLVEQGIQPGRVFPPKDLLPPHPGRDDLVQLVGTQPRA